MTTVYPPNKLPSRQKTGTPDGVPVFDESGSTLKEIIEDKNNKTSINDKLALYQCLNQLEDREKKIIILRYFKDMTQTKTADIMGVSQVQISRIESRVLDKLRKKLG